MIGSIVLRLAAVLVVGVYLIRAAAAVGTHGAFERGVEQAGAGRSRDAVATLSHAKVGGRVSEAAWQSGEARLDLHDLLWQRPDSAAETPRILTEATRDFLEALRAEPASGWYYDGLSGVYLRRERAHRAGRTLEFSQMTAQPWSLVGDDGRVAIGLLRMAIARERTTTAFRDALVLALDENGLRDDAIAAMRASAEVLPDFAAHGAFDPDTLPDALLEAFYDAARDSGGTAPLVTRERQLLGLARLGERLGHLAAAEADYRAALEAPAPELSHAEDAYYLAMMLIAQGRFDEAAGPLTTAERLPVFVPNVLAARANIAARQGRLDESLAHLDAARRLAPRRVDLWLAFADAARRLGKTAQAEEALRWAIVVTPNDPTPRVRLAELYLATGERGTAAVVISELQRIVGNSPDVERLERSLAGEP